jgi:hypothetical protein
MDLGSTTVPKFTGLGRRYMARNRKALKAWLAAKKVEADDEDYEREREMAAMFPWLGRRVEGVGQCAWA